MATPSFLSLAVAALVVSLHSIGVEGFPWTDHGIMSIKNCLPYPIHIMCKSNVEARPFFHAQPGASLEFDFDKKKHLFWTCTFLSDGTADGNFLMWSSGAGELCLSACQWRADLQGLRVLRNGSGNFALVYFWKHAMNRSHFNQTAIQT